MADFFPASEERSLFPSSFVNSPIIWYSSPPPVWFILLQSFGRIWPIVWGVSVSAIILFLYYGELRSGVALIGDHVLVRAATPWSPDLIVNLSNFDRIERGCIYNAGGKFTSVRPIFRMYRTGQNRIENDYVDVIDFGAALNREKPNQWLREIERLKYSTIRAEILQAPYDLRCERIYTFNLDPADKRQFRELLAPGSS